MDKYIWGAVVGAVVAAGVLLFGFGVKFPGGVAQEVAIARCVDQVMADPAKLEAIKAARAGSARTNAVAGLKLGIYPKGANRDAQKKINEACAAGVK